MIKGRLKKYPASAAGHLKISVPVVVLFVVFFELDIVKIFTLILDWFFEFYFSGIGTDDRVKIVPIQLRFNQNLLNRDFFKLTWQF
jgi:hypothetical protein